VELEDVVIGLVSEECAFIHANAPYVRTHHKTGYLAYWLGAAVAPPLRWPPSPPPHQKHPRRSWTCEWWCMGSRAVRG